MSSGKRKVLVALSGGVDSAAAAVLLREQGYEVCGVTFIMFRGAARQAAAARRISAALGIPHRVRDISREFEAAVVRDFCAEYGMARTPNPCVICNQKIKFPFLFRCAREVGACRVATGHYARLERGRDGAHLLRGMDRGKDQSYFLYRLRRSQLTRILFPLGTLSKTQAKELAKKLRLPVLPGESQEACFLAGADYRDFLRRRLPALVSPGAFLDTSGTRIGTHRGLAFYTVGQREGLGLALGFPAYVVSLDAARNVIVVGTRADAFADSCLVSRLSFTTRPQWRRRELTVKVRYNHPGAAAVVCRENDTLRIRFRQPQFALTPGQSVVLYDGDRVLGGGIIERQKGVS